MLDLKSLKGIIAILASVAHHFKLDKEQSRGLLQPDLHQEASLVQYNVPIVKVAGRWIGPKNIAQEY